MDEQATVSFDPSAGGHARAQKLPPERRSEIARDAANKRWHPAPVVAEVRRPADDGIREHHGLTAEPKPVRVWEGNSLVHLDGAFEARTMTPAQARYLGDQLFRLAGRIERRADK